MRPINDVDYKSGGSFRQTPDALYSVAFNPYVDDQQQIATAGGSRLSIYTVPPNNKMPILDLQFVEDSQSEEQYYACIGDDVCHYVAVAGETGILRVIHIQHQKGYPSDKSGNIVLKGHTSAINHIDAHPSIPMILFTASKDTSCRMWNVVTQQQIAIFGGLPEGHSAQVVCSSFNDAGDLFASTSLDHKIAVWSVVDVNDQLENGKPFVKAIERDLPIGHTNAIHLDYVDCVKWIGELLITKSCKESISIWTFRHSTASTDPLEICSPDYRLPRQRLSHMPALTDVHLIARLSLLESKSWFQKFSISNGILACGNNVGKVAIWNIAELDQTAGLKEQEPHKTIQTRVKAVVREVALSDDADTLIAVTDTADVFRASRL